MQEQLSKSDINALLSIISEPRDIALIHVMLDTGLKLSEATELTTKDIKWKDKQLKIPKKRGKYQPLHPDTIRALETWLKQRPSAPHTHVFLSLKGTPEPLSTRGVDHIIRTYGEKAQLGTISARTLRNTFLNNYPEKVSENTPCHSKRCTKRKCWILPILLSIVCLTVIRRVLARK